MADARLDIEDALSGSTTDAPVTVSTSSTRERLTSASGLVLVALIAAALTAWATRSVPVPPETTRTLLSVSSTEQSDIGDEPTGTTGWSRATTRTAVALSPDSKTLVFGAIWGGDQQLYARAMDHFGATPISGTSGGSSPFFLARRTMGRLLVRRRAQEGSPSEADRR